MIQPANFVHLPNIFILYVISNFTTLKSLIEEHARLIFIQFFSSLLADFQPARLKKNPDT